MDPILIFMTVFIILNSSTKLVRDKILNIKQMILIWGKVFFLSFLFIIPVFILINLVTGSQELVPGIIKFCIALLVVSFLSIPFAVLLNKIDPFTKNKLL